MLSQTPHSIPLEIIDIELVGWGFLPQQIINVGLKAQHSQYTIGELASLRQQRRTIVSLTDTKQLFIYPLPFWLVFLFLLGLVCLEKITLNKKEWKLW